MISLYSQIGTYFATHDLSDDLRDSIEYHAEQLREQFTLKEMMQYVDEETRPAWKRFFSLK